VLLVAALAAASVSAAASPQPSTNKVHGGKKGPGHAGKNGKQTPQLVGTGQFANAGGKPVTLIGTPGGKVAPANASAIMAVNRIPPGKLHRGTSKGSAAAPAVSAAAAAPAAAADPSHPAFTPHAHSLKIQSKKYAAQAPGLNAFDQESVGGYANTPPDNALAAGNGFVFQAVNSVFQITDSNFGHVTNAEPMEQFWAPALLVTGFDSVSSPKAHYDNVTRKWYVTSVAYGAPDPVTGMPDVPGSAIFIATSTTSDPLSVYNIFFIDTSGDGMSPTFADGTFTSCFDTPDGCLADTPKLGMNRNAVFVTTNAFEWDTGTFFGAQIYIVDSTALAAGILFPNVVYIDVGTDPFIGAVPEAPLPDPTDPTVGIPNGCGTDTFPLSAYCWNTIQPATTPDMAFNNDRGGTELAMASLDWLGSVDNRIALWAFTNTKSISSFAPLIFFSWTIVNTQSYGFPFTDTPGFSPYAEQPGSGNTPFCDFAVGPFCEPGPIANNDDGMQPVVSVKATRGSHVWGALNTDALVADPLGKLHRRSAIAYFDLTPTLWGDRCLSDAHFICTGGVNGQGYVANWNNDVVFPAIGVGTTCNFSCGDHGAMVYTLTGNTNFPSVAVSAVNDVHPPQAINVVLAGQDVLDDFAWYLFGTPRFGDYSAAEATGHTIYLAAEYIQHPSCSDSEFIFDPSCGGTRGEFSNWGTGLVKVNA
jgi:hypothetical protein